MESLFRFFVKYHVFMVFVFLEVVAISLIYNSSNFQQSVMIAQIDAAKGRVYSLTSKSSAYFGLKRENELLADENARLRNELDKMQAVHKVDTTVVYDTTGKQLFAYVNAEVLNNSTNRQKNYFTINIGRDDGIKPDMGIISDEGVVGTVWNVSDNFARVMSVLNTDFTTSAKLKRTDHFGPLVWDGISSREALLINVPQHAEVSVGDTVVTSGHSAIFPQGIMIGTVESFEVKKGNSYEIRVALSADFGRLRFVNAITSMQHDEIKELESVQ